MRRLKFLCCFLFIGFIISCETTEPLNEIVEKEQSFDEMQARQSAQSLELIGFANALAELTKPENRPTHQEISMYNGQLPPRCQEFLRIPSEKLILSTGVSKKEYLTKTNGGEVFLIVKWAHDIYFQLTRNN